MSENNGGGPVVVRTCPECGASLRATLDLYVKNVVVTDGKLDQWELAEGDDLEASVETDLMSQFVYCENDHKLEIS